MEWGEDAAWEEQQAIGGIGRRRSVVGDSHSFVRERRRNRYSHEPLLQLSRSLRSAAAATTEGARYRAAPM